MRYFDFEAVAKRVGAKQADLKKLGHFVRAEFPDDDMMFELHMLRALMAIESGQGEIEDILNSYRVDSVNRSRCMRELGKAG